MNDLYKYSTLNLNEFAKVNADCNGCEKTLSEAGLVCINYLLQEETPFEKFYRSIEETLSGEKLR